MKHTDDISDEQLTRFLNGDTTPEEEAEVLDYAASADENAEDLLNIAAAIRTQQKTTTKSRFSFRPVYWAAAVLVLFLAVGAGYLFNGSSLGGAESTESVIMATTTASDTATGLPVPATATQSAGEVRKQLERRQSSYTMERRECVTAAQGVVHYADSTAAANADTQTHCLKSITL